MPNPETEAKRVEVRRWTLYGDRVIPIDPTGRKRASEPITVVMGGYVEVGEKIEVVELAPVLEATEAAIARATVYANARPSAAPGSYAMGNANAGEGLLDVLLPLRNAFPTSPHTR